MSSFFEANFPKSFFFSFAIACPLLSAFSWHPLLDFYGVSTGFLYSFYGISMFLWYPMVFLKVCLW